MNPTVKTRSALRFATQRAESALYIANKALDSGDRRQFAFAAGTWNEAFAKIRDNLKKITFVDDLFPVPTDMQV